MSWKERVIGIEELRPYLPNKSEPDFRGLVEGLAEQQLATWPMLRDAVAGLARVEYKGLRVRGSEVLAQFNPQGIEGNFGTLLDLALDLGGEFFVVYNGAACGASAPDHLHFQACEGKSLPIIREVETWERRSLSNDSGVETFTLKDYRLNALITRGNNRAALIEWFDRALQRLAEITGAESEPMINLVVTRGGGRWTVIVFPRGKHRPDRYFAEGDAKLTVSPAAIDLAGVLVVPQPDHFAKITSRDAEEIYAEVTLNKTVFDTWLRNE